MGRPWRATTTGERVPRATPAWAVVDVPSPRAGKPALRGAVKSGLGPRQFAVEPNGKTLLVTNTGSGQVEAVNVGQIP